MGVKYSKESSSSTANDVPNANDEVPLPESAISSSSHLIQRERQKQSIIWLFMRDLPGTAQREEWECLLCPQYHKLTRTKKKPNGQPNSDNSSLKKHFQSNSHVEIYKKINEMKDKNGINV